jgi:hypothetical protein
MKVIHQGIVKVRDILVFKQSAGITLMEIDTVAKHAVMWYSIGQFQGMKGIFLHYDIDEDTLNYTNSDGDGVTEVFLEGDWDVWSCNHSRYTTRLALYRT